MALQKQSITIPIDSSIDTKRDEFLTDRDSFLVQENTRFQKTGAIQKRFGYDGANTGLDSLTSFSPKRIVSDSDHLFLSGQASEKGVARYFNGQWSQLGQEVLGLNTNPAQISLIESFGGDSLVVSTCMDYFDGIYAIVCNRSRTGAGVVSNFPILYIYDGSKYISSQSFTVAGNTSAINDAKCSIIEISGVKYIVVVASYFDGSTTSLKVCVFNLNGTKLIETDHDTGGSVLGTAIRSNDARTIAYASCGTSSTNIRLLSIDQTGITASSDVATSASISSVQDMAIGDEIAIICIKADNYPVIVGATLLLVASWEQAESNGTLGYGTLTVSSGFGISANGSNYYYSFFGSSTSTSITTLMVGTSAGFVSFSTDFNVRPSSRPELYNSEYYMPVCTNDSSFSTLGYAKMISGRFYYVANAFYSQSSINLSITGSGIIGNGKFSYLCLVPARIDVISPFGGAAFNKAALYSVDIENSNYQYGSVCNMGESLAVYSGSPSLIDGTVQRPLGFFFRPSCSVVTSSSGGSIGAGTYLYKALFEASDDQGNIIRSEESDQFSIATTGATSSNTISVKLSSMVPSLTQVTILRTRAGASTFFVLSKNFIEYGSETFTYIDTTNDSSIGNNTPTSYTTGGVLENTPCPPSRHATIHNNRIFIVPADEKNKVYYSKKILNGEVPAFSVFQFIEQYSTVSTIKDDIVATAPVGDKLIVFRENSVYWIAGDGVNELGANSTFSDPELLSLDLGCVESSSVIPCPVGVMFKSNKGIYLIDNGLGVKYIGDRVEQYNSEEITSSAIMPEKNIVAFSTLSRILIYDYLMDKWSIDTIDNVASLASYQNKLVILKTTGEVGIEGVGYQDSFSDTSDIQARVTTGWIKLTGIQDFGRIYRLLILGRFEAEHQLNVNVYYDYDESYVENYFIFPDISDPYQFKINLIKQKCQSIKFEIFDTGEGESMELTGLTLEVGVKRGTAKIATTRQY